MALLKRSRLPLGSLLALALAGCSFHPRLRSGAFDCGEGGLCPPGTSCSPVDNRCYAPGDGPAGGMLDGSSGSGGLDGSGASGGLDGSVGGALDAGGSGGHGDMCVPQSCAALGKNCGAVDIGCGITVTCGSCSAPSSCGTDGASKNVCICTPTSCAANGWNCGTADDGCGGTLTCGGACPSGQTCGANGKANVCGVGLCVPKTCKQAGATCGPVSDGCGGILECGSCPAGQSCGADGKANVCGCVPTTCGAHGWTCGTAPDDCGGTLDCWTSGKTTCPGLVAGLLGTCGNGKSSGANICSTGSCTAITKCPTGACGVISDGCSGTLDCGNSCPSGQVCGGGGSANVCGCLPKTCDSQGFACGKADDGCGKPLDCGNCPSGQSCGADHTCS